MENFGILTPGDSNFDLSQKMTEMISKWFFASFRTLPFVFLYGDQEPRSWGGVQTPPPPPAGGGKSRGPAGRGLRAPDLGARDNRRANNFSIDQTRSQKGFSYAMEGAVTRPGLDPARSRSGQYTLGPSIQPSQLTSCRSKKSFVLFFFKQQFSTRWFRISYSHDSPMSKNACFRI